MYNTVIVLPSLIGDKNLSCVFTSFFFFRVHFAVAICHYLASDEKIEALRILIKSKAVIPLVPVMLFWKLQVTWMLPFTCTSLLKKKASMARIYLRQMHNYIDISVWWTSTLFGI